MSPARRAIEALDLIRLRVRELRRAGPGLVSARHLAEAEADLILAGEAVRDLCAGRPASWWDPPAYASLRAGAEGDGG